MSTYLYSCERCRCKVPLTRQDYRKLRGRVRCDDCQADQQRVTTARKLVEFAADRALTRPCCAECGSTAAPRKHTRLDRNLRDEYRLLCLPCGQRLGFRPVSFQRFSVHEHGRETAA